MDTMIKLMRTIDKLLEFRVQWSTDVTSENSPTNVLYILVLSELGYSQHYGLLPYATLTLT